MVVVGQSLDHVEELVVFHFLEADDTGFLFEEVFCEEGFAVVPVFYTFVTLVVVADVVGDESGGGFFFTEGKSGCEEEKRKDARYLVHGCQFVRWVGIVEGEVSDDLPEDLLAREGDCFKGFSKQIALLPPSFFGGDVDVDRFFLKNQSRSPRNFLRPSQRR